MSENRSFGSQAVRQKVGTRANSALIRYYLPRLKLSIALFSRKRGNERLVVFKFAIVLFMTFLASELSIWPVFDIFYGSHLEIQDGHQHQKLFLINVVFLGHNNEGIATQIIYLSCPVWEILINFLSGWQPYLISGWPQSKLLIIPSFSPQPKT